MMIPFIRNNLAGLLVRIRFPRRPHRSLKQSYGVNRIVRRIIDVSDGAGRNLSINGDDPCLPIVVIEITSMKA
jgi:hypothetical protein